MGDLDGIDAGLIERPGNGDHLIEAVSMADRMHAIAQRHVLNIEAIVGAHATLASACSAMRSAVASARVRMGHDTLTRIRDQSMPKGDVLEVARLAGIMAAKRTADLIPLCHPLGIDKVQLEFSIENEQTVRIEARVSVHARTGVEMEALTAVSVAALTIYDMCKAVDRDMTIGPFVLLEKSGGKSGHYQRT